MLLRGRRYDTAEMIEIVVEGGVIASVRPAGSGTADFEAGWIAPALFDLQINGCHGHSFNSARLSVDDIRDVVKVGRDHGIGSFFPTLVTNGHEALAHGMSTIRRACEDDVALRHAMPGIHLEGPYISPEDGARGAHPRQHVRPPDWDEFRRLQEAAGGRIKLVTLAPEIPGAVAFIEKLVASSIVVALGHTAAKKEDIRAAVTAGARLSTHLGNGSHAMLPRHDNYIWEQLADDDLCASIICDGHHLPATLVKCFLRVKTPRRIVLTCDAGSLAGLPPGRYREWEQDFDIVPEGKIVLAGTGFLAGSWAFTDLCVANVLRFTDVSLAQAIDMAGAGPRALLSLEPVTLTPGSAADLILFEHDPTARTFEVRHTIVGGKAS